MSTRASGRHMALRVGSLFLILLCARAAAAPADAAVPAPLEPWRAWVMKGHEYQACPFLTTSRATDPQDFLCAWPSLLTIEADKTGASFTQHWRVDAETWVPLPGDTESWPQQVSVDGQPALVLHQPEDAEVPCCASRPVSTPSAVAS